METTDDKKSVDIKENNTDDEKNVYLKENNTDDEKNVDLKENNVDASDNVKYKGKKIPKGLRTIVRILVALISLVAVYAVVLLINYICESNEIKKVFDDSNFIEGYHDKDGMVERKYKKHAYNIYLNKKSEKNSKEYNKLLEEYADKLSKICGERFQGYEFLVENLREDNIGGNFVHIGVQQIKNGVLIERFSYTVSFEKGELYEGHYKDEGILDGLEEVEKSLYSGEVDKREFISEEEIKKITHTEGKKHYNEMYKLKNDKIVVKYYLAYSKDRFEYVAHLNETSYMIIDAKTGEIIEAYYDNGIIN